MVKKSLNPADFRMQNEKKLNKGRTPGFIYDVSQVAENEFITYRENATTEDILRLLDTSGYVGELYPVKPCLCVVCDFLPFKLLNFATMWAFEPYYNKYIFYFEYDAARHDYLTQNLKTYAIQVYSGYTLTFTRSKMPKFCPEWSNYHVGGLPKITDKMITDIMTLECQLIESKGYYFNINRLKDLYRVPQAVCGRLSRTVLPLNAHIVLERILQIMSHSTAILENTDLAQPYRMNFKEFLKPLQFAGRKAKKQDVARKALNDLINIGLVDSYAVDEIENLVFIASFITKHIRQQIKRPIGYYADMSAQKPYMATFVNYLWWLRQAGHEKLTIALDTLLTQLNLERLLKESRNAEIARILNDLRHVGVKYKLLKMPENPQEITSADVKYLLKNRTKLHEFIKLVPSLDGKESKKNGK